MGSKKPQQPPEDCVDRPVTPPPPRKSRGAFRVIIMETIRAEIARLCFALFVNNRRRKREPSRAAIRRLLQWWEFRGVGIWQGIGLLKTIASRPDEPVRLPPGMGKT